MGEETEKPTNKIGVVASVSKKPRHRKKLLYQELKKQMEFYFSDVNISKDRFMNELLQESPYVPISVFLKFNRIKAMTSKEKDIAQALQLSELLKVTECGTKVYRTSSPRQKENSDECTIYVEQLPLDADHNWLIDIFQVYGPIDYVSIPKFKHSRKNKGFAFVEFKDPQSAKNALAAFSDMGCRLSNQMEPGNLCSIRTFEENENEIANKAQLQQISEDTSVNDFSNKIEFDKCPNDSDEYKKDINQRKRKISQDNENDDHHCKKRITDCGDDNYINEISESKSHINEGNENEFVKRKRKFSESDKVSEVSEKCDGGKIRKEDTSKEDEESINNETSNKDHTETTEHNSNKVDDMSRQELFDENVGEENYEDNIEDKRKKNRKRKKRHRRHKSSDVSYGLQILSKVEWKSLRNKYLNDQRKKMKELKQYLRNKKYSNCNSGKYGNNNRMEISDQTQNSSDSGKCVSNHMESTDMTLNSSDKVKATDTEYEISSRLKLSHGQIVKITLPEPVVNKSSFKNEAKIFPEIKYVDIKEGSDITYLRFSSASAAEQCVQSGHWQNAVIIKGDEEKAYWDMIAQEREEKLSASRFVRKGRDKLLKKAEKMHMKHIWFE